MKFTSPKRFSIETIDGFLETRNRLITSGPNLFFQGFIEQGTENPLILPEAEKALQFRSVKRNQHDDLCSSWTGQLIKKTKKQE